MVCNSGVSLIPDINGEMHHFVNSGLYDALFIMEDEETKTLWNHVTGEALYGKTLLVYLDPETFILSAIYVESRAARREGQDILLDNGLRIRSGRLVDADDRSLPVERPQQIFTRWYGFSLTFPDPEIYE